jgi:serine/threonine protein kinase
VHILSGAFPEPLVRRYAADIIEGLHFLHAKNFIHRDIKSTNLLVSGGRVKLGDFGCSTMLLEDEETYVAFVLCVVASCTYTLHRSWSWPHTSADVC